MTTSKPIPAEGEQRELIELDPETTFSEFLGLAEIKEQAAKAAAATVEQYLWTRVRVLATDRTKLQTANAAMGQALIEAQAEIAKSQSTRAVAPAAK